MGQERPLLTVSDHGRVNLNAALNAYEPAQPLGYAVNPAFSQATEPFITKSPSCFRPKKMHKPTLNALYSFGKTVMLLQLR